MNSARLLSTIQRIDPLTRYGRVRQIVGLIVESVGPPDVALGELCILGDPEAEHMQAEVVGFRDSRVLLMPLGQIEASGRARWCSRRGPRSMFPWVTLCSDVS